MKTYYFIGIKGSGMSALATILYDLGNNVLGSDVDEVIFTEYKLRERGIEILPFSKDNLKEDYIVIAGNAFNDKFEEVVAAKEMNLEFYRYHQFLGELSKQFISIGVSGTHGKTTTTSMLSLVFKDQKETAYLIGDGTGFAHENSEYLIFEACEYRRHFLSYFPKYTVITNIELDHVDYYKDLADYKTAFSALRDKTERYVIACGDDENTLYLKADKVLFYGTKDHNDIVAKNIIQDENGNRFDVYIKGEFYHSFNLKMFGTHNLLNALSSIAIAYLEGLDPDQVQASLSKFEGAKRRFVEYHKDNQVVVDDYAHHPTEVAVTIDAARQKYPDRTIIAIFQPHTFTRVKAFVQEFADALNRADIQYVCDIFGSVREPIGDITIDVVKDKLTNGHKLSSDNLFDLKQYDNAVLLFMGSEGDIYTFVQRYINE